MKLRCFFLLLALLAFSAAGFFAYVQDLFDWLPGISIPVSTRAIEDTATHPADLLVPQQEDWIDYGHVLEAGAEGEWDFLWADETPGSIIKKDGLYYFYFIAADGNTSVIGEPRRRSIGVATSQDGIHYTKYPGNPIVTFLSLSDEVDGANSAGITLDDDGKFVMYYGGASGRRDLLTSDGRLAVSDDGFHFTDQGLVMHHLNPFLYGFGDEIFPTAVFHHRGIWYVYYLPNGGMNNRTLGMAWGNRPNRLFRSTGVLDDGGPEEPIGIWGNVIRLAPDRIAMIIQRLWWPDTFVEVRTASPDAPHRLNPPLARYDIPNLRRGAIFLDHERRTWFMLYNDFDRFWDLKLAPAGALDSTPPSLPQEPRAIPQDHAAIELSWQSATDPETGVVLYHIYRDGEPVGSTKGWRFLDSGLEELSSYSYEISAVNFHGIEGPHISLSASTPADFRSPDLLSASTRGEQASLWVTFNEPVDRSSAEDVANYIIHPDIEVSSAALDADGQTVKLTTTNHAKNIVYTIQVTNVFDAAAAHNPIHSDNSISYTHSPSAGLAGYWSLDQGSGTIACDLSGYENDGAIAGAVWQAGIQNSALWFDGIDDYVQIDDRPPLDNLTEADFTFSAWVHPEDRPAGNNSYPIVLRVNGHPAYSFGLSYGAGGRYRAHVITTDDAMHTLRSEPVSPQQWHHVVMVVETGARLLHLYLDGQAIEGSPFTYSGDLLNLKTEAGENYFSGEYYLGSTKPDRGAGSFHSEHFKGLIDEVRVYDRALDPQEIYCLAYSCR